MCNQYQPPGLVIYQARVPPSFYIEEVKSIYYLFPTGYEPGLLKSFTALHLLSGCVFNKQTFNQFHISPPSQPPSRYFEYLFSLEEAESLGTWGNS